MSFHTIAGAFGSQGAAAAAPPFSAAMLGGARSAPGSRSSTPTGRQSLGLPPAGAAANSSRPATPSAPSARESVGVPAAALRTATPAGRASFGTPAGSRHSTPAARAPSPTTQRPTVVTPHASFIGNASAGQSPAVPASVRSVNSSRTAQDLSYIFNTFGPADLEAFLADAAEGDQLVLHTPYAYSDVGTKSFFTFSAKRLVPQHPAKYRGRENLSCADVGSWHYAELKRDDKIVKVQGNRLGEPAPHRDTPDPDRDRFEELLRRLDASEQANERLREDLAALRTEVRSNDAARQRSVTDLITKANARNAECPSPR